MALHIVIKQQFFYIYNNTVRRCWHWPSVDLEIAKNIF